MITLRLLFLLLVTFAAEGKTTITWLQTDWPPHQIVSGPFQGQGTFDLIQQQIAAKLPQFNHQTRLVNLARLEQAFLQQDPAICALGTLYSEQRAKTRLFSTPVAVGPALAVGYIAGRLTSHPAMVSDGADIQKLALDRTLTGAYQPNRYYPPVIMVLLQHPDTNLVKHAFTSEINAAALLAGKRVDYVVEYPERMQYYNQLLEQPVALEHQAIRGADIASISYVTCSTDVAGQSVITSLNQLLPALWQQQEYLQAIQTWLDDSARQRLGTELAKLQQQALMQLQTWPHDTVNTGH